jgi:hypothetical protein
VPWLRVTLYALIVGGLVAVPLWRSLDLRARAQGRALLVMITWVSVFGWLETHMGVRFDLVEHEHWDDRWLDLVRWIGWIPVAIGFDRLFRIAAKV